MTGWTEYDAAHHLLTAPLIADETQAFINEKDFDWSGLFDEAASWSTSERMLVQGAFDLWSGGRELDGRRNVLLVDPIWTLDDGNFDRMLEAVLIRRGRRPTALR